jgi:hypothetical protein
LTEVSGSLRAITSVLEHDGYLAWDEATRSWSFVSPLMRDWWRKRFGQSHLPLEGSE